MNLPIPPNDHCDDTSYNKVKKPSIIPDAALQAAQQKHRKEEREAITLALKAHFSQAPSSDITCLEMRWEASVLNQLHLGTWDSLWTMLNLASRLTTPALCARGMILFGGWLGQPTEDLTCAPTPPQELLSLLKNYSFYSQTLHLIRLYDEAKTPELIQERRASLQRWLKNHPDQLSLCVDDTWNFKPVETLTKSLVKDLRPIIKSHLINLDSRSFLFLSESDDLSDGWKKFLSFMRDYSTLPSEIINSFGDYCLVIQTPH